MSIQIDYTGAGDLLIRCGDDYVVWPLSTALRAAAAIGAGAPAAPITSPAPAPSSPSPPPPKPPKIGYPPPLPGAMTIVSRRLGGMTQWMPWFAADWPVDPTLELPLGMLQSESFDNLQSRVRAMVGGRPHAGCFLTVHVQPSLLHAPLDIARLQRLADDPTLGLEGVKLQFGAPDAGVPK